MLHAPAPVTRTVRVLEGRIHRYTNDLVNQLNGFFPELQQRQHDTTYLRNSVQANLRTILKICETGVRAGQTDPPPEALYWARYMARQKFEVEVLRRIYYVGYSMIWESWLLPEIDRHCSTLKEHAEATKYARAQLFAYLDHAALRVVEEFTDEQLASPQTANRFHKQVVEDILNGKEPSTADLLALGHPVDTDHLACVFWQPETTGQQSELETRIRALSAAVNVPVLTHMISASEGIVWFTAWPTHLDLTRELERVASGSTHVAHGGSFSGSRGFLASLHEAQTAMRLIRRADLSPPTVHSFEGVRAAALLTEDVTHSWRFAQAVLGKLSLPGEVNEQLRSTYRVFLESGKSYSSTAKQLYVHRNTVLYRVQKAEQMLQDSSSAGASQQNAHNLNTRDLLMALTIVEWMPSDLQQQRDDWA